VPYDNVFPDALL